MENKNSVQEYKILIFKVGQEEYGVHIDQVVSIERMQTITAYPNRSTHVLGVATLRDMITPVVDLRSALAGEEQEISDSSRIIVFQVWDKSVGLLVDSASDVLGIELDEVQHPNLLVDRDVSYLNGISKIRDRLIILLDVKKLLEKTTSLDELKEIKDELEPVYYNEMEEVNNVK